jgi:hypothetical protein
MLANPTKQNLDAVTLPPSEAPETRVTCFFARYNGLGIPENCQQKVFQYGDSDNGVGILG